MKHLYIIMLGIILCLTTQIHGTNKPMVDSDDELSATESDDEGENKVTPVKGNNEASDQSSIYGTWLTARVPEEGEVNIAKVKVEPCKSDAKKVCGKIVWLELSVDPETGKAPLDKYNPEEGLRTRPVMCMQTILDMEPTGEPNSFEGGELYSARTGKTYSGSLQLKDPNHLLLTGSVLFGIFSRTTEWTRVENPGKDPCH